MPAVRYSSPGHRVSTFTPRDPAFRVRVEQSFARQGLMASLGATLIAVAPGQVEIALAASPGIAQQHGFIHAGALAAVADSAAGYAALTLLPPGVGVLTAEFKINLMAPARGRVRALGHVVRAGRTLTVAQTEVVAEGANGDQLVALLTATVMTIEGRDGVRD